MIVLKNDKLTVEIKPYGAELSGIFAPAAEKQYLWQGDPSVWSGQAPILFPIVGRLASDSFTYGGKKYYLQKHGFARKSEFDIVSLCEDTAVFRLESGEETHRVYPFDFALTVEYKLVGNKLLAGHRVKNTGKGEMYFSIGAHPGFNIRLGDFVEFNAYEDLTTVLFDEPTLAVGEKPFASHCKRIEITEHLFDADALFFSDLSSTSAKLVTADGHDVLKVSFPKVPYVGLWAKPGAPFICIEPWQGIADTPNASGKLEEKPHILRLNADEEYLFQYAIEILEI